MGQKRVPGTLDWVIIDSVKACNGLAASVSDRWQVRSGQDSIYVHVHVHTYVCMNRMQRMQRMHYIHLQDKQSIFI